MNKFAKWLRKKPVIAIFSIGIVTLLSIFQNCGQFAAVQVAGELNSSSAVAANALLSNAKLSYWKGACKPNDGDSSYFVEYISFLGDSSNPQFEITDLFYADSNCQTILRAARATRAITGIVNKNAGWDVQDQVTDVTATLFTQEGVAYRNSVSYCGFNNWNINAPQDLIAIGCTGPLSNTSHIESVGSDMQIHFAANDPTDPAVQFNQFMLRLPQGVTLSNKMTALQQLAFAVNTALAPLITSCSANAQSATCALVALGNAQLEEVRMAQANPSYDVRIIAGFIGAVQAYATAYQVH